MMDHRVAQAPVNPATIAVAFTEPSQERNIQDIILSGAFARCLQELGQCVQSGLMINADSYSNHKVFVRLL